MSRDPNREYAELLAAAQALVAWEEGIGGVGFPATEAPPPPRLAPAAPAPRAGDEREPGEPRGAQLARLTVEAATCTACALHQGRTRSVFSRGRIDAELMMIGEGPGQEEDEAGLPFVGPAGQLLDKMIAAMGYARDEVYVCDLVKCRVPGDRGPSQDEASACKHFLDGQIDAVRPRLIVALGRAAAERLSLVPESGRWRGILREYRGVPALATLHPATLLRSPEEKKAAWADLKLALRHLGRTPP